MKKIHYILLILCYLSQPLISKIGNVKFERISIQEGLSQSSVRSILQDRRGFMWFGTVDGLNKYDGYTLKVSKPDPNNPNSLSSPFLRAIIEDHTGVIWAGTNGGGLNKLNPTTGRFVRYQNDPRDPRSLSNNYVWALCESRKGILWIGTDGGGLNKFDPKSDNFTNYRFNPNNPDSISHNSILSICEDRSGMLWIGTRGGGLNKFDPITGRFVRFQNDPQEPTSLSDNHIWALCESREGVLWIGTDRGGLNRYDQNSKTFVHYRFNPNDIDSLSHDGVWSIFEDNLGLLWIGTNGGGLNKFNPISGLFTRYQHDPNNPNSLSNNHIYSIYEDSSGVLWIGTETGGVNKLIRSKELFNHYKNIPNNSNCLNNNHVWSIYEDSSGVLWIGTRAGGLNKFDRAKRKFTYYQNEPNDPYSLSGNFIRKIYKAPTEPDVLWIGTDNGGLNKFNISTERFVRYRHEPNNPNSISSNRVYSIFEDKSGVLWIGTRTGGLNKLDRKTEKFASYMYDPDNSDSLSNNFVYIIYEDSSGILWVGTFAGGLNKFNRKNEKFICYQNDVNDPMSLSSNCVLSIYEDRSGILWIGTGGGGLNRFDRESEVFSFYGFVDGLPNQVIYGILEDDLGFLWLSTNNGITRFDPRKDKEEFRNYNEKDGLQSNEFNGGSYFMSPRTGEMFFGGINGFTAFYSKSIKDNTHIPPIVITSFLKFNKEVDLDQPVSEIKKLKLSYRDYVFSFEFAALDFTAPEKNMYAYKMEGVNDEWIYTDSRKRFANYTTLAPGEYVFRVSGSNNDGKWNEEGISVKIIITPPFWQTLWFRILAILIIGFTSWGLYRRRMKNLFQRTRMEAELQTAHIAQMSIMPQKDPEVEGFDISGICIPAYEVGGDFFDYFWLNKDKSHFGLSIGDVSGKGMKAAMTAIMAHGIIFSRASEAKSVKEVLKQLNRSLYYKTEKQIFTTLSIISINLNNKEMALANAGFPKPLLKSDDVVVRLENTGSKSPLGVNKECDYQEKNIQLNTGDLLVFYSDGISDALNSQYEFFGRDRLFHLLRNLNVTNYSSKEILEKILEDISKFSGDMDQHDDMTLVVIKVL